jgi:O-antigen ligase
MTDIPAEPSAAATPITAPPLDPIDARKSRYGLGWAEAASFWLLIVTLAWAPFPLGSNRSWSWSLLTLLVAASWALWGLSIWRKTAKALHLLRRVAGPIVLVALALSWGLVQIAPFTPVSWSHPIWSIAADGLGKPLGAMISLNAWRTLDEIMKLATYVMAAWLAYVLCQRAERAALLLNALIVIGAFYAAYALAVAMLGTTQTEIFYATPRISEHPVAPFVGHAHFATFIGLATLCACAKLFSLGAENITAKRGVRPLFLGTVKFVFGSGFAVLLSTLLLFSMLTAAASRAGFAATLLGMAVLLIMANMIRTERAATKWTAAAVVVVAVSAFVLFQINGDTLQNRFDDLSESSQTYQLRTVFWDAATRMVADSPFLGVGLGGFEYAYPMYADHIYPFNIDKVHDDYLELALGWGLPASIAWAAALAWLTALCGRAVFVRRRFRIYPLIAVGATALVAFHALVDFSLQIPAVALSYAAILGLGVSQAFSSRA